MYVIRPALRASPARPPVRFIRGRRYPSTPRFRGFHTTRAVGQAANPPPLPDSTPIGDNDASKPAGNKAAADEHSDGAVAKEDPELLAQKLQRSRETSRRYSAALRRQQRSKKADGLPPVHVPDWFLRERVIRHADSPEHTTPRPRPAALSVSLAHEESGEQATCFIPGSRDLDAAQVLSQLVRSLWGRRLDEYEWRKVEKYLDERLALAEKPESTKENDVGKESEAGREPVPMTAQGSQASSSGHVEVIASMEQTIQAFLSQRAPVEGTSVHALSARESAELKKISRKLEEIRTDANLTSEQRLEQSRAHETKLDRWTMKMIANQTRRASMSRRISPIVNAEIRATIAASLTALNPASIGSFPSAKTNVILHSAVAEHDKLVENSIYEIAEDLGADVITLKAQDLAQLAGDYLGEGTEPTPRSVRSLGYETYRMNADLQSAADDMAEGAEQDESDLGFPSPVDQSSPNPLGFGVRTFALPLATYKLLADSLNSARRSGGIAAAQYDPNANTASDETSHIQSQSDIQLEDLKLANLLESLLDATEAKQARGLVGRGDASLSSKTSLSSSKPRHAPAFFDYSVGSDGTNLELNSALPASAGVGISMSASLGPTCKPSQIPTKSKIIYVKDFKELNATHYGGRIIQKLEEVVRKRRIAGESVMIVGSTCSLELTPECSARYV